ncbi:MAG: lysophospholipid acyltransferase family protein [Spirochaetia bacterium]|nr:lysophospholipid acyltransferase family protein [Spirochaetia bacterium]
MKKFLHKIFVWTVAFIIRCFMQAIGRTVRVKIIAGEEILKNLLKNRQPVIFSFWHNRIFFCSYFLYKKVFKKGVHLTVLISQSKDGEWIAKIVEMWGGDTARGSTTRGGKGALLGLIKNLRRKNGAVVTTPDGPKGPVYKFQAGTLALSQMTQVAIVPVTYSAKKTWVFNSWDKFIVPKPFTKAHVAFGEPITIPHDITEKDFENRRKKAEEAMMELVKQTEDAFKI